MDVLQPFICNMSVEGLVMAAVMDFLLLMPLAAGLIDPSVAHVISLWSWDDGANLQV
jgi:hypothetical protein